MRRLLLLLCCAVPLRAQSLPTRISTVRDGTVRLQFAADSGVCGNGRGNIQVRNGDASRGNVRDASGRWHAEWEDECEPGPVRIALDLTNGQVTALRSYVGGHWVGTATLDLGDVSAADASAYLLQLASRAEARVAKDAVFPAVIAEGPSPDAALLALAKDSARPNQVRSTATFWLAQSTGERVSEGLRELVDDPQREVRESAVFSLSQRPNDESVPALIRLARTHRDPNVRRTAVFWLGQKRDERALRYFEEVLLGR